MTATNTTTAAGATLEVTGANGSLKQTASYTITQGGPLISGDNSADAANSDRLNDTAAALLGRRRRAAACEDCAVYPGAVCAPRGAEG